MRFSLLLVSPIYLAIFLASTPLKAKEIFLSCKANKIKTKVKIEKISDNAMIPVKITESTVKRSLGTMEVSIDTDSREAHWGREQATLSVESTSLAITFSYAGDKSWETRTMKINRRDLTFSMYLNFGSKGRIPVSAPDKNDGYDTIHNDTTFAEGTCSKARTEENKI